MQLRTFLGQLQGIAHFLRRLSPGTSQVIASAVEMLAGEKKRLPEFCADSC